MKGQFITDHYINYFSEVPLLFKQQGSDLSQLEDTHVLSIIYYQLFTLWGTSGQQQVNRAVWLGWRSGSFHKSLTPRNRADLRGEEWQPCGNASGKWPGRDDLCGSTTSQVHWQGKPLPQQGKTKALSTFLCLLQSLQITFPIFSPCLSTR